MKHLKFLVLILLSAIITLIACQDVKEHNNELKASVLVLPQTISDYTTPGPGGSPFFVDNDKATLGRVLFYDRVLSINNTVSCATCHKQSLAFSDNKPFSVGFGDHLTSRNSMAIVNPGRNGNGFFWDLRVAMLDSMVVKPVQNHIEMGFDDMYHVIAKISQISYYPNLFKNAFGTTEITQSRIQTALAEFLRAMNSYRSKYDEGATNGFKNFTAEELLGKELLTQKLYCRFCHSGVEFKSDFYQGLNGEGGANIGLEMFYKDKGINMNGKGEGFFKIPSLRNVELTAPYMHDGRFKTLEEVIEHYNSGVVNHPDLSMELKFETTDHGFIRRNAPVMLNLTTGDKKALVAFLKTLTDYKLVGDERFSNPFKVTN